MTIGKENLSLLKNDLHKITVTLRQQSAQLAHDKEFLQQLLGNISHQLRTPLTGMLVMADLLARPDLPLEKAPGIYRAAYCTAGTNAMVTGETFDLVPVGCRVPGTGTKNRFTASLLDRATAPVRVALELRGQTLKVECPQDLLWDGDEKWTAEAVTNLVKNASEHSPEGGLVKISVSKDVLNLWITVEDNGPGIPELDMPYLFRRFYRGSNAAPGSAGIGLGFGGRISSSSRRQCGGRKSDPSPGARFILKLPIHPGNL